LEYGRQIRWLFSVRVPGPRSGLRHQLDGSNPSAQATRGEVDQITSSQTTKVRNPYDRGTLEMCSLHRALTPFPLPLRIAKTGRNHLNEEITLLLPTGIGERFSQTISNLGHAAFLRRCELPL
jgi:hypothetical protein